MRFSEFLWFFWLPFLYLLLYIWYFTFLRRQKCRDKINKSPQDITFVYSNGFLWFSLTSVFVSIVLYFTFLLQHKCRDKINNSPWNVTFIYFSGLLWFLSDFRFYIFYLVSNILHFYYNTDIMIKLIKVIDILLSFTSVNFYDFFRLSLLHNLFYIWYFIHSSFLLHDVRSPTIYVLQEVVRSKLNSLHVQRWIGNLDWNCFT